MRRKPVVQCITGHKLETESIENVETIDGLALVAPAADANLLSLMEMVKHNGGSFHGNKDSLVVKDGAGRIVLKAQNPRGTISGRAREKICQRAQERI